MINSEIKSFEDIKKLENERVAFMVKCSCGHTMTMVDADRPICTHCGHWVYRTKQIEFKYKMMQEMRKNNDK